MYGVLGKEAWEARIRDTERFHEFEKDGKQLMTWRAPQIAKLLGKSETSVHRIMSYGYLSDFCLADPGTKKYKCLSIARADLILALTEAHRVAA